MNDELNYAEMLEIPVETVHINKREKRKKGEPDLKEQLIEDVNERVNAVQDDPAYAESTPIARAPEETRQERTQRRILLGEFIAACALCATIFFTNIFLPGSAVNTFLRGLFAGGEAETADTRVYTDFALSPLVNDSVEAEIAVSDTGVLSFTAQASVYPPADGTLLSVNGDAETGYTVEVGHSDCFSTIVSGLDTVYFAAGDALKATIPMGISDGEGEVRVMFYSDGSLINGCTVSEDGLAWS